MPIVYLIVRPLAKTMADRLGPVLRSVSAAVNVFGDSLKSVEIVRDVFQSDNVSDDLLVKFLHI